MQARACIRKASGTRLRPTDAFSYVTEDSCKKRTITHNPQWVEYHLVPGTEQRTKGDNDDNGDSTHTGHLCKAVDDAGLLYCTGGKNCRNLN